MKRIVLFVLLAAFWELLFPAQEQKEEARQLTIEVFSARQVRSLTMTPLGKNEWIRSCHSCPQKPVTVPLTFNLHSPGAEFGGSFLLRVNGEANGITGAGIWRLRSTREGLQVLLTLDSEPYVALALSGEAAPNEQLESLKAMAVTIRTYALENAGRHAREGFDLCDSTHCQALRLGNVPSQIEEAVRETAGETLWYGNNRASSFYTQNCGGQTEAASNAWPQLHASYLAAHSDPYCMRRASSAWRAELALADIQEIFRSEGWRFPERLNAVNVTKRTAEGRALELEFVGSGARIPVAASSFRFAVNRRLGWNQLRSDWYTVTLKNGALIFNGKGYGHGVGLCQAGSFQMAAEGHSYREILGFYFPGTRVGIGADDHGWQLTQGSGWTLQSTTASAELLQRGNAAWAKAQMLFPPRKPLHPIVRQFPTTELFRQSTSEAGWILAATRGNEIDLQPESILKKNSRGEATLLHEFLHVLVDQEASQQAPLWLREGLVEALAEGSAIHLKQNQPVNMVGLDAALAHPSSQAQSQRAHTDAAILVETLISSYGLDQIRQWLRSGSVPEQVMASLPQQTPPEAQPSSNLQ
jgi:stage II sporulation protein D